MISRNGDFINYKLAVLPFLFSVNFLFCLLASHLATTKRHVFLYVFALLPQIGLYWLSHWLSTGHIPDFSALGFPHSPLYSIVKFPPLCFAWQRATRKTQNDEYVVLSLPHTNLFVELSTWRHSANPSVHLFGCFSLLFFAVELTQGPWYVILRATPDLLASLSLHFAMLKRHLLAYVLPSLPQTCLRLLSQGLLQVLPFLSFFASVTSTTKRK